MFLDYVPGDFVKNPNKADREFNSNGDFVLTLLDAGTPELENSVARLLETWKEKGKNKREADTPPGTASTPTRTGGPERPGEPEPDTASASRG